MPAADAPPAPSPSGAVPATAGRWGWFFAAVAGFVLVAHGCHGPDEDHEPVVVPWAGDRE